MELFSLVNDVTERFLRELALQADCPVRLQGDSPIEGTWDCLRLEQVVGNLLSNAFKDAGRRLPVEFSGRYGPRLFILVITDRGPAASGTGGTATFRGPQRAASMRHYGGSLGLGLYVALADLSIW